MVKGNFRLISYIFIITMYMHKAKQNIFSVFSQRFILKEMVVF
jgi:hypothetical protein